MDIRNEILKLKKEKGAIILAHYYQIPEIQEIADYVGDSYYLSKIAKDCEENIIVFVGLNLWQKVQRYFHQKKRLYYQLWKQAVLWQTWLQQMD